VAIAPYAVLSNAVLNISREYAPCFPLALPRAGMKRLPSVLGVQPGELDPATVLEQNPVTALIVAADGDRITSSSDMKRLFDAAAPGSELIIVPDATHETVTYHFNELIPPVLKWLNGVSDYDEGMKTSADGQ
jgi:hypothetical protein